MSWQPESTLSKRHCCSLVRCPMPHLRTCLGHAGERAVELEASKRMSRRARSLEYACQTPACVCMLVRTASVAPFGKAAWCLEATRHAPPFSVAWVGVRDSSAPKQTCHAALSFSRGVTLDGAVLTEQLFGGARRSLDGAVILVRNSQQCSVRLCTSQPICAALNCAALASGCLRY